ncbi:MAG: NADH-quinone oxidoreductase subunit NuoE [Methanobacteriota archaeon]
MEKDIESIISKYSGASDLIDALEDVQEAFGHISEDNMHRINQMLKIPLVDIIGVVTFYSAFKTKAPGKHIIKICRGTACHIKGSAILEEHLEDKLGIKEGETTEDGKFTLEPVNCIGACAKAPTMMVDDIVYGDLTKERIDEILGEYK